MKASQFFNRLPLRAILLWSLLLNFCLIAQAQKFTTYHVDSLFAVAKGKTPEEREKLVYELSRSVKMYPGKNTGQLFKRLDSLGHGDPHVILPLYQNYATYLILQGKSQEAISIAHQGLKLADQRNDIGYHYDYLYTLTNIYVKLNQLDSATLYAAQLEELTLNNIDQLGNDAWQVYLKKADIQGALGNNEKSGKYYEKAYEVLEKYPKDNEKNKGILLFMIAAFFQGEQDWPKFSTYLGLLEDHFHKKNISTPKSHYPIEQLLLKEDTPEAIAQLRRVIEVADSLNNYKTVAAASIVLAKQLLTKGDATKAVTVLEKATNIALGGNYSHRQIEIDQLLRNAYVEKKDYQNAYLTLLKEKQRVDSIRSQQITDKVTEYEVKFETQKKEQELQRSQARQNFLFWILGFSFFVLVLVLSFLFQNKKQAKRLTVQKTLLEQALYEKNILLKEIHHRVKNNLQVISGLLKWQSNYIKDENALHAINEGQTRVQSMAIIHQKLYQDENLKGINVKDYIKRLGESLFHSYNIRTDDIQFNMNIKDINLDIDTVIPLGLILNELISNALKHAFKDQESGQLYIALDEDPINKVLLLKVSDNGIGMPAKPPGKAGSFGWELIETLTEKLEGEIEIVKQNGTTINLRFKEYQLLDQKQANQVS